MINYTFAKLINWMIAKCKKCLFFAKQACYNFSSIHAREWRMAFAIQCLLSVPRYLQGLLFWGVVAEDALSSQNYHLRRRKYSIYTSKPHVPRLAFRHAAAWDCCCSHSYRFVPWLLFANIKSTGSLAGMSERVLVSAFSVVDRCSIHCPIQVTPPTRKNY